MPNQTKRRTSSRTRAKKASTTKGLVTPATQNKSNKTLSDDFDNLKYDNCPRINFHSRLQSRNHRS